MDVGESEYSVVYSIQCVQHSVYERERVCIQYIIVSVCIYIMYP